MQTARDIGAAESALLQAESLLESRDLVRALREFDRADRLGAPDDRCAAGRWMVHMLRGEYAAAWRESDGIRARGGPDPHRFWSGACIDGTRLIVRCLHGFGDAVQMLRYAPALRARCAKLIVEVPPALFEIAPWFDGVDEVITWGDRAPARPPKWDLQVEVMELPYLFRTLVSELPLAARYLRLPDAARSKAAETLGGRRLPRVGIVWAAGEWNRSRSLGLEHVENIVAAPGCEWWNLQGGHDRHAWATFPHVSRTGPACGSPDSILSLAALIEQLDLVITVDTLAAHLAGALGTPAWVLLQNAADWRWMTDRRDTPWYPSLRLYRQGTRSDWQEVVQSVMVDLKRWLSGHMELAG